jgi:pilus assembly protein CpaC
MISARNTEGTSTERRFMASRRPLLRVVFLILAASNASVARAQTARGNAVELVSASSPSLVLEAAPAADIVQLTVGRSVLLSSTAPLRKVYVGNPTVLQTYTSGSAEVVLTARSAGVSSLMIWDEAGGHRLYTVFANVDTASLCTSLEAAFPGSSVRASAAEGKIFLTGSVGTDAASDAAVKLASQFAKEVVNSVSVIPIHGKQVQLKLRVVEVDRTRLEQLGINIFAGGRTSVATTTGQYASSATETGSTLSVSDPLNILLYNAKLNLGVTVRDLEQKEVLQVLAEPTLTTLSGVPARFLAGGEFPFPVIQPGGAGTSASVTIQFRPYGVKVDFTPTVNADGTIHLKLAPEVSTLDYSNAVTISGFTIPALSTRRAETEVEIRDGESFAFSGLLDHRTTEVMSKVPGIADIPILGQLFRSKSLNHSVLELVVIVTASVIDPLSTRSVTGVEQPNFIVPELDPDAFDSSGFGKIRADGAPPMSQPTGQAHGEKQ